jgi:large subunit ribosomal protein L9
MELILLEKIRNLGDIGNQVKVKSGFGRNFLIPEGKAVSATKENIEKFAKMKAELLAKSEEALQAAKARADILAKVVVTIPTRASEEGKLFGSVGVSTVAAALKKMDVPIKRSEISMPLGPIRQLGEHEVTLILHTDVATIIKVKVVPEEA